MNESIEKLRSWFLRNRREFPWRESPTPYEVWISEVMLQQTQSSRVIDFYKRWMRRFPTIELLALAPLEEVLKLWEGLGYYSRARSLHAGACDIVKRFSGKIPSDAATLKTIKGLGPYTVGAICAFGFHQKMAAVDANVVRVLTRLYAIDDDISKPKTLERLRTIAQNVLPDHEPHIIAEALIELGAAVCKKTPNCPNCPLKQSCASYKTGNQTSYPVKSQKIRYETLERDVAVIMHKESYLVRQGRKGIACSGLYEFPYFDTVCGGESPESIQTRIHSNFQLKAHFLSHLDEEKQSFTRFRVTLYPKLFVVDHMPPIANHEWHDKDALETLTFSSGHKRILTNLIFP